MASKSAYQASEKGAEIEEQLDAFEKLIERLRAMYEQYFLGIAKMAPSQLHTEAERRQRDLTQIQIKNTALRYRYATLSQKFGAYNTYWKRTMRMIEQGKYVRDLQRVQRKAQRTGEEIPEEILASMPKIMRERVRRDREAVAKIAELQGRIPAEGEAIEGSIDEDGEMSLDAPSTPPPAAAKPKPGNVHVLDDALVPEDVDLDEMFASLTRDAEAALDAQPAMVRSARPTEPSPPPVMAEPPRKRSGPTTPPLRPPPLRSSPPPVPAPGVRSGATQARPAAPTPAAPARPPAPTPPAPTPAPPRPATAGPARPPPAARPGASARPAAPLGPPPGMSDSETRSLYNRYLKARELCGESNDGVTYDKLLRTLRSQSSKIMTDHQARGVEFGVVIKDNKVVLRAKPKP